MHKTETPPRRVAKIKSDADTARVFDPELLFVECYKCGQPIFWEKGKTTDLLHDAGIAMQELDERCMIMAQGCPQCSPHKTQLELRVVRLAAENEQHFEDISGNA